MCRCCQPYRRKLAVRTRTKNLTDLASAARRASTVVLGRTSALVDVAGLYSDVLFFALPPVLLLAAATLLVGVTGPGSAGPTPGWPCWPWCCRRCCTSHRKAATAPMAPTARAHDELEGRVSGHSRFGSDLDGGTADAADLEQPTLPPRDRHEEHGELPELPHPRLLRGVVATRAGSGLPRAEVLLFRAEAEDEEHRASVGRRAVPPPPAPPPPGGAPEGIRSLTF